MLTGYLHPDYALSFSDVAVPFLLPHSGGWLLKRFINGTALVDGMGCYPLFCCSDWHALPQDIKSLQGELVSIVLVADPFGEYTPEQLASCFDVVTPFKDHFVIETGRPLEAFITKSHRGHAQRALREVSVERCENPLEFMDDWQRLFAILAERHSIQGLRYFSRATLERQLSIPGSVVFRAVADRQTIGIDWWYVQGDCAQGHLAAYSPRGYELRASYATKWRVIEYFSDKVKWINLGAAATGSSSNGLSDFKRGWSTGTKRAWLCGSVLNPSQYAELVRARGDNDDRYFPAYRAGEFA